MTLHFTGKHLHNLMWEYAFKMCVITQGIYKKLKIRNHFYFQACFFVVNLNAIPHMINYWSHVTFWCRWKWSKKQIKCALIKLHHHLGWVKHKDSKKFMIEIILYLMIESRTTYIRNLISIFYFHFSILMIAKLSLFFIKTIGLHQCFLW